MTSADTRKLACNKTGKFEKRPNTMCARVSVVMHDIRSMRHIVVHAIIIHNVFPYLHTMFRNHNSSQHFRDALPHTHMPLICFRFTTISARDTTPTENHSYNVQGIIYTFLQIFIRYTDSIYATRELRRAVRNTKRKKNEKKVVCWRGRLNLTFIGKQSVNSTALRYDFLTHPTRPFRKAALMSAHLCCRNDLNRCSMLAHCQLHFETFVFALYWSLSSAQSAWFDVVCVACVCVCVFVYSMCTAYVTVCPFLFTFCFVLNSIPINWLHMVSSVHVNMDMGTSRKLLTTNIHIFKQSVRFVYNVACTSMWLYKYTTHTQLTHKQYALPVLNCVFVCKQVYCCGHFGD